MLKNNTDAVKIVWFSMLPNIWHFCHYRPLTFAATVLNASKEEFGYNLSRLYWLLYEVTAADWLAQHDTLWRRAPAEIQRRNMLCPWVCFLPVFSTRGLSTLNLTDSGYMHWAIFNIALWIYVARMIILIKQEYYENNLGLFLPYMLLL